MLKFFAIHGKVVDKVNEIILIEESKRLEKHLKFITQKKNTATNDSEKGFYKLPNNAFYRKTMENDRNRIKTEFIRKDDNEKN